MKKNTIILSAATVAVSLLFSGLAFASFERPGRVESEKAPLSPSPITGERVTTNGLLMQILVEVMKGNTQKVDNRCSDGEKSYSPGYVISAGNKTLRCDIGNGYPEWVEGDKS